jgi:hypothetical protein
MEAVTEGVNNLTIMEQHKKNRIQVSNTKKPLFFYVNLAKVRSILLFPVLFWIPDHAFPSESVSEEPVSYF